MPEQTIRTEPEVKKEATDAERVHGVIAALRQDDNELVREGGMPFEMKVKDTGARGSWST